MPTSTFFRLPEEKRLRLIEASWEEFTTTSFSDASINKIIRSAHIPRGSFYQYFEGKEDLFSYLVSNMQEIFLETLKGILARCQGDIFLLPIHTFDYFIRRSGEKDQGLARFIQLMHMNKSIDIQDIFSSRPRLLCELVEEPLALSGLKQTDKAFLEDILFLLMGALAGSVMDTLHAPDQWEKQRNMLNQRVELIKFGGLMPADINQQGTQGGNQCLIGR